MPKDPELNAIIVKTENLAINYRIGDETLFSETEHIRRSTTVISGDQVQISPDRIEAEIAEREDKIEDVKRYMNFTRTGSRLVGGGFAVLAILNAALGGDPSNSEAAAGAAVITVGGFETLHWKDLRSGTNGKKIQKQQGKIALLRSLLPNTKETSELPTQQPTQ